MVVAVANNSTVINVTINIESARSLTPWAEDESKAITKVIDAWSDGNEVRTTITHTPAPGIFWGVITIHCLCNYNAEEAKKCITELLASLVKEVWIHSYFANVTVAHGYQSSNEVETFYIARGATASGLN